MLFVFRGKGLASITGVIEYYLRRYQFTFKAKVFATFWPFRIPSDIIIFAFYAVNSLLCICHIIAPLSNYMIIDFLEIYKLITLEVKIDEKGNWCF